MEWKSLCEWCQMHFTQDWLGRSLLQSWNTLGAQKNILAPLLPFSIYIWNWKDFCHLPFFCSVGIIFPMLYCGLLHLMSLWRCFLLCQCPPHACPNLARHGWLIIFDGALLLRLVTIRGEQSHLGLLNASATTECCLLLLLSLFTLFASSISSCLPQPRPITGRECKGRFICLRQGVAGAMSGSCGARDHVSFFSPQFSLRGQGFPNRTAKDFFENVFLRSNKYFLNEENNLASSPLNEKSEKCFLVCSRHI